MSKTVKQEVRVEREVTKRRFTESKMTLLDRRWDDYGNRTPESIARDELGWKAWMSGIYLPK